ncbi:Laccase-4 [Wickerhamomyces ciferrii]|uniref:Laccase-4 n=1 Tax=Wickerhamomyces ciferrii (strain ATCC 14091 / BCRC 22168 / CBS 111 / JCM 3599 / NBRC 0793 / NRRL Y-1031 F-60-10) TaxID=1206466 RepID=K0K866_WICCF|nr:Laccase-4 [Wickerhamomyces ciferrii]CCH41015.1 Laccase-4 [Wickerhamomyces ciferrii]
MSYRDSFEIEDEDVSVKDNLMGKRVIPEIKKRSSVISWCLGIMVIIVFALFITKGIIDTEIVHDKDHLKFKYSNFTQDHQELFREIPNWKLDTNKEYKSSSNWNHNAQPTIREYNFTISNIIASPDGIKRNMTVINDKYPGPLVECNSGDTLRINVFNNGSEPTSIHFHGLFFKNLNYYDGATSINQCEIPSNKSFTYEFQIDKDQYGTYWYHSHFGTQYADGVLGPLVIHSKEDDKNTRELYDEEYVIIMGDYYHDVASNYLDDYLASNNENDEPTPDNGLIQGSNVFSKPDDYYKPEFEQIYSNHHVFKFKPDTRYRLRLINVGFFADLDFSIDNHPLTIIEADGTLVKPLDLEVLNIAVAQRYSVIINTNQSSDNNMFWMHAKLNHYCFGHDNPWLNTDTKALVTYTDHQQEYNNLISSLPESLQPNTSEYSTSTDPLCKELDESLLHPLIPDKPPLNYKHHFRLDASFFIGAYQLDRGFFNSTTYRPLKTSSTLYKQISNVSNDDESWFETKASIPWDDQFIININERNPEDQVVDILINNLDDGAHPFHIHGYKFWILRASSGNFKFDHYYEIDPNKEEYMKRDTVNIPGYGYALLRIVADNPGVWPLHCHIGWHMEAGLLMQLNVLPSVYKDWEFPEQWLELCDLKEQKST